MKAAGLPSPLQSDLDAQVNTALQKIYSKQLYDGGWNWWDGDVSDPQTSAYVIYGLLEAKESGYEISQTVLDNGIAYLKDNLPDLQRNDASWQYNRYAFMLYVLARADELGAGQTNFIFEHRASLDLYGEAYLAQAMYLLNPEDSRISTLLSDLATATVQSAAGAHWEETTKDYWNWNSDTRTTAIVLNAFVQIDPTESDQRKRCPLADGTPRQRTLVFHAGNHLVTDRAHQLAGRIQRIRNRLQVCRLA